MGWPSLLVMVRHAESEGNVRTVAERAKWNVGSQDYPLTARGKEQASITGRFLQQEYDNFDVYYVSYYQRSRDTMRIMYPEAKVYEDPRLAEAQRGIWHSMTESQIKKRWPEEIKRKQREGSYHYRAPGGENWPDVELRIHSFLGTLGRGDYCQKKVLIVVHGFWLILFQRLIHHFSIEEAVRRYRYGVFENASVTAYKPPQCENAPWKLISENYPPWQI